MYKYAAVGIVVFVLGTSLILLTNTQVNWPGADELVFVRITERLPAYESYAKWWTPKGDMHPVDWLVESELIDKNAKIEPLDEIRVRSASQAQGDDELYHIRNRQWYDIAYDTVVWRHPPLANYLSWPAVKLLFSEEDVRGSFVWLRLIAWSILAGCIGMAYWMVSKRINPNTIRMPLTMLTLLPVLLIFTYKGNNWFYHDIYMLLFLTIALVLRGTKYEKYIYIPLSAMVASKIYGVLFLLPFIIENRKTALCALVLVPYWTQTWWVSGDPLYLWQQWQRFAIGDTISTTLIASWSRLLAGMELFRYFLITISPFFIYFVYKRRKMRLLIPLLFVLIATIGVAWGPMAYHLMPLVVMMPLLAAECLRERSPEKVKV